MLHLLSPLLLLSIFFILLQPRLLRLPVLALNGLKFGIEMLVSLLDCLLELVDVVLCLFEYFLQLVLLLAFSAREQVLDILDVVLVGLQGAFSLIYVFLQFGDGVGDGRCLVQALGEAGEVEMEGTVRWLGFCVHEVDVGSA